MTARDAHQEPLLDVNHAARLARRSPETVRRWVWSGKLAARRQGRRLMISHDDLAAVVAEHGASTAPTLAEWATTARRALAAPGQATVGSAADLVLDDRRHRTAGTTGSRAGR